MLTPRIILFFRQAAATMLKALPPGARWITVRPNGPGTEGHPILIQPSDDGAYRVIGGAGGKLNYLKLTGVKSEAEYAATLKRKAEGRREERKRQRERDRADGLTESKKTARESIKAQLGDHQAKFISTVAEAMGWKEADTRFPEEKYQNVSEAARTKAAAEHGRNLLRQAQEAVDQQRQRLLQDGAARAEAGLAEVPMTAATADELSVQDLDPVAPATKGLGYSTDYNKRAEAAGLTKEELAEEVSTIKPPPPASDPVAKRAATVKAIQDELQGIKDRPPQVDPRKLVDAKQAVALLKAEKALKAAAKQAREKAELVNAAKEEVDPKAYVLEVGAPADPDVVAGLENDLRTLKTRAFLEEAGRQPGGIESLGRHIGVGAFNSVNALALAAGGASLVDRSVVDVLGVAGAAQVLARRLHKDLTPEELATTRDAMERFHVDHYMNLSDQALRDARSWQEAAQEIELGDAGTGAELAQMQELNATRRELVGKAQQTLGTALGEMEANAALVLALKQPGKDQVAVSLGKTAIADAIRQARAIGLDRGDYRIEQAGASTVLTVFGPGLDKLAQPVSKEDLMRTRDSLDIIEGHADEPDWLPAGVTRRPEMAMNVKPGTAPRLAKPMPLNPTHIDQAVKDFIGGRIADGDSAADVMAAALSEDTLQRVGDRDGYMQALDKVAPLYDADGKMIRAETHQAAFEKMADAFVSRAYGTDRTPLHRQQFSVDQGAVDALHSALAAHPEGVAAFKPIGELTPQDQAALRDTFAREYGRADPEADKFRAELEAHTAKEPEKEVEDMFGRGVNPAWRDWQGKRDELGAKVNAATMTWGKYLDVMGSPANAYAAMQDVIRSKVLKAFADHHNRANPGKALAIGKAVIANDLNHLDALDPQARERRLADRRELTDRLRNRVGGQYASGSVGDKLDAARAAEEAQNQAQMGLFGETLPAADPSDTDAAPAERAIEMGERYTLGQAAERQIAGMMPIVGRNFRPGQPVQLWRPDMSGAYVGRQRAVKLIAKNRRTMLGLGVGSGKTSISLAGFTHQHAAGAVKRGLFVVPSVVQGQFHGEALTVLEPGKYNWHCNPGANRAERIAAYKNPDYHFNVVTHQAFRDDMIHLAAERDGSEPGAVAERLDAMAPAERKAFLSELMTQNGIDHDYLAVDEGHNLLNRAGKANSNMANVMDAVSANMKSYVNMTADPVKNDPSEVFDVLAKMDPERYTDRGAFLRKYGVNTEAAKDGLRREMAKYFYTGAIDPGVKANSSEVPVQLNPAQHERIAALDAAAGRAKLARMQGGVDVEAMRTLSPNSFAEVDPAQHEAVARRLQTNVAIMHNAAIHHAINGGAKLDAVAAEAKKRAGKPGVVFSHSLEHVHAIAERLKAEGRRPVMMTGAHSSKEKDAIKRAFTDGKYDVLVASDAGAVGANLQTGKWLIQADTPQTAMLHAQRRGRIHRIGQTEDVDLVDLVADHPAERRARKRLADKYELRGIMTSPLEGLDDSGIAGYLQRARAGEQEAAQPLFMAAKPEEVPAGLAEDPQGLLV